MTPDSCMRCMRVRTSSPVIPNGLPTTLHGSGTSGRPAWVSRTRARSVASSGASCFNERSDGQVETDMKLLLLGHIEYSQACGHFDFADRLGNSLGGLGGQHEPHIEALFAAVVMSHHGKGIHGFGHTHNATIRHCTATPNTGP